MFLLRLHISLWLWYSSIFCNSINNGYTTSSTRTTTRNVSNSRNDITRNSSHNSNDSHTGHNFGHTSKSKPDYLNKDTLDSDSNSAEALFSVVYWDVKPYIFKDEQNKIAGIIPRIFEEASYFCKSHIGSQTLISYQREVKSRQTFYNLLRSNVDYEKGMFMNVSRDHATWLPIMTDNDDNISQQHKGLKSLRLTKSTKIAVIVPREAIGLTNKIYYGIVGCRQLFVLFALLTILFAILTWLLERGNNDQFSGSFINGAGTAIWWSIVTMATVGYGEIVPRSVGGRTIAVIWIFTGILIGCVITATVTNFVADSSNLSVYRRNVSVLRNSFEEKAAKMDHGAFVLPADSYDAVIALVREKKVFAAMINADVASWHQNEYESDSLETPLRIVTTLPANLYINALLSGGMPKKVRDILYCMHRFRDEVFDHPKEHYQRYLHMDTLYAGTAIDLLATSIFTQFILGITIGLIIFFMVIEIWKSFAPKEDNRMCFGKKNEEERTEV